MYVMYLSNIQKKPDNHIQCIYFLSTGITSVNYTQTCLNESFHDHGPQTESINIYMIMNTYNIRECHWQCKNDETCSGYTYYDDLQRCVLSNDAIFLASSPCVSCRFYEKTCQSCMYSLLRR